MDGPERGASRLHLAGLLGGQRGDKLDLCRIAAVVTILFYLCNVRVQGFQ